jgi:hypothetical protein
MIALIFVVPALCCAPSRACLCCILLLNAFIMHVCISRVRAGFLPAFVHLLICLLQIDVPPSRWLLFAFGNFILVYSLSSGLYTGVFAY